MIIFHTYMPETSCLSLSIYITLLDRLHIKREDMIFTTYTVSKVVPLFLPS